MALPARIVNLCVPVIAAMGDVVKVRLFIFGAIVGIGGTSLKAFDPESYSIDLSTSLRDISGRLGDPDTAIYECNLTAAKVGIYTFFYNDPTTSSFYVQNMTVTQWATNMDNKISDILKQRTEISRLRTTIQTQRRLNNG
ncbi:MAG: hypothetical protein HQM09_15210 [Candidatus Riflebacteria bacterium]|nr:hypothetical protein [Candidatus Riflebacteria bacterium]